MIKAFLFDYGGVISKGGGANDLTEKIASHLNVSLSKAYKLQLLGWGELMIGKIDASEFWKRVENSYGMPVPDSLRNIWNGWENMKPEPEMVACIELLKTNNYRVGLLSNTINYTANQIRDNGGYAIFDFTILSCEVGVIKPDPKIYKLALDKLDNIQPYEVAFLDDQEKCLIPAREMGINAILVKNTQQAIDDINDLIINHHDVTKK